MQFATSCWNCSELSCLFVSVQNRSWFCNLKCSFPFTFEGNIQCAKKVLRLASAIECADGDDKNKIVVTSTEAMEFSRENYLNLSALENPFNLLGRSRYFFLRRPQNSPITSHARPTIKECNHATCTGDKKERSITQLLICCWPVNILKLQSLQRALWRGIWLGN